MMKTLRVISSTLLCFFFFASGLHAQATLSFQGILKKSNGVAVDDGEYSITFNLYNMESGGTALWSETQSDVEVTSGIYSVLLGSANPLNVSFNEVYYLGIKIGSTEMTPRFRLTSAPYALSLIGQSNLFPSAGTVKADELLVDGNMAINGTAVSPTHSLQVVGGVLAREGAPGANGNGNNGYAFNVDRNSGMFSTADGTVSLFTDNTERLKVTGSGVEVTGNQTVTGNLAAGNLNLGTNGTVAYNGNSDWRLVQTNYFESGVEGWSYSLPTSGQAGAWNNFSTAPVGNVTDLGDYAGKVLLATNNDQVFKKQFNLASAGSYTYVKVVFNYYMLDGWTIGDGDNIAWAAFSNNAQGSIIRSGWTMVANGLQKCHGLGGMAVSPFPGNFNGLTNRTDEWIRGEMVGRHPSSSSTSFWVFFGFANNNPTTDENFAINSIEVWVR